MNPLLLFPVSLHLLINRKSFSTCSPYQITNIWSYTFTPSCPFMASCPVIQLSHDGVSQNRVNRRAVVIMVMNNKFSKRRRIT